jgi:hypothetical protein
MRLNFFYFLGTKARESIYFLMPIFRINFRYKTRYNCTDQQLRPDLQHDDQRALGARVKDVSCSTNACRIPR